VLSSAAPPSLAHRPVVMGDRGMVVAGHHRAAEAGAAVLRAGGTAIDAAIATSATLAIAIPFMNGLGGDCFALVGRTGSRVVAINGSGAVPLAASVSELRRRGLSQMPERGPLSVSVPGLVAALGETAERYASLPLPQLLEPAIALAEEGIPLDASAVAFFNGPIYEALCSEFPKLVATFGRPGEWSLGQRLRQPAAASTLRIIAREGWQAFYEGPLARSWLAQARVDGVLLDAEDLAMHATTFADALRVQWNGKSVYAAPPNSQGLALLALLACDGHEPGRPLVDDIDPLLDPRVFLRHKLHAFELRDAYCVDPRRIALPTDLMDVLGIPPSSNNSRVPSVRVGGGDTSTFVAADCDGNVVSWVQSLFEAFGSGIVCEEQGIVLHNRAALEQLSDDVVHGLRGGYRPFHTLCPALVTAPDGATIAIATPGDHGQPQTLALVLRRHLQQGLDIQAAIEWPRLRHDAGQEVMLEDRCPAVWDALLHADGWTVRRVGPWSRLMGGVNAIVRRADGLMMGGADPRRSSYAVCA
jgi:gamma-glutamyltranspeptidase/glutathione hydrolase